MKKMTLAWTALVMMLSACTTIPPKQTIPATATEEQVMAVFENDDFFEKVAAWAKQYQSQWLAMGHDYETQKLRISIEFPEGKVPNPTRLAKMEQELSQIAGLPVIISPERRIW